MYWCSALSISHGTVCFRHEENSEAVLVPLYAGQVHHCLALRVLVVHLGSGLYQRLQEVCVFPPGCQVHGCVSQGLLGLSHLRLGLGVEELLADIVISRLQGAEQRDAATGVLLGAEFLLGVEEEQLDDL